MWSVARGGWLSHDKKTGSDMNHRKIDRFLAKINIVVLKKVGFNIRDTNIPGPSICISTFGAHCNLPMVHGATWRPSKNLEQTSIRSPHKLFTKILG